MKSKHILKKILFYLFQIIEIAALSLFYITFVGQRCVVYGDSMNNTFENGESIIVEKISYRFKDIERFDIVIFDTDLLKNAYITKRIIGLPNETIKINENGDILIKNLESNKFTILEENYGFEKIEYAGIATNEITLGPDEYFVLGDNRNKSTDSRFIEIGPVKRNHIKGKAWLRIFPFNKICFVDNIK